MSHDNRAGEKCDNSWETEKLSNKVRNVANQEDETGFLYGVAVEGLIYFEEIAETKAENCSYGKTEEIEYEEIEDHPQNSFDAVCIDGYSRPLFSSSSRPATVL